jgi:hypothetical protein
VRVHERDVLVALDLRVVHGRIRDALRPIQIDAVDLADVRHGVRADGRQRVPAARDVRQRRGVA